MTDFNTSRVSLVLADGTPLLCLTGKILPIKIGEVTVKHPVLVADISEPVILGLDFMREHDCQIDIPMKEFIISMERVPCSCRPEGPVPIKVRLVDHQVVPPRSQVLIWAKPDRIYSDLCIVGPIPVFEERYSLKVASCLTKITKEMVPVRLLNVGEDTVQLHLGTPIAFIEPNNGTATQLIREGSQLTEKTESLNLNLIKEDIYPSQHTREDELPDFLKEMFDNSTMHLEDTQRTKVAELLIKMKRVFAVNSEDLGRTDLVEHEIDTGTARPIKQRPRRTPIAFKGEEEKEIQSMLKKGAIRESNSPWSSPVVLVRKKDGSTRFCVDYRRLNEVTRTDSYPLPRMEDCLDSLAGAKYFSTVDMASGYWQIKVKDKDQEKTAFVTKSGLYEFIVMPFGLVGAPSTFERCMEKILRHLQWQTCLVYLDDIIVFSKDFTEHLHRLEQVLQRIQEAGLKLKPSKCHLFQKQVSFLGHVVSEAGIATDPKKVEAVVSWPPPINVSQVRSYLGFCSYYRRFIQNFSVIANPLSQLTRKDVPFIWSEDCQRAFEELKSRLVTSPIMAYPLDSGQYLLDTDASDVAIGAVLSQTQNGELKVIAYASRTLNKAERKYCVTRKELLAIVNFTQHFRHYLLGREFKVRSDHQPLKWLFNLKDPSGQVARWLEILAAYNFVIDYRPGKKHNNADGMSRRPCDPRTCSCPSEDDSYLPCGPCKKCHRNTDLMQGSVCRVTTRSEKKILAQETGKSDSQVHPVSSDSPNRPMPVPHENSEQILRKDSSVNLPAELDRKAVLSEAEDPFNIIQGYSKEEIIAFQELDPDISPIKTWKEQNNERPMGNVILTCSPATRHLWLSWDLLHIKDKVLYRRSPTDGTDCLVVPRKLQQEIMEISHGSLLGGHLGQKKTLGRLRKKYFWFQMKGAVNSWIKKCIICASNKRAHKKAKGPLGRMQVGAPLDRIGTDLLGPLPLTPRGNRHILVVQDYFTKWVEIFAVPDATAETCANYILNGFISRYGISFLLHSDQGRNYESDLIYHLCKLLGIKKTRTSPRHPAGNGMVERFNQTLIKMIRSFIDGKQNDWDLNLGCLAGAYRSAVHESTGFTPNMLMLGREARNPADVLIGETSQQSSSYGEYVERIQQDLWEAHHLARTFLNRSTERQEDSYNVRVNLNSFQPGEVVWLLNESRVPGRCPKLQNLWLGPYLIQDKFGDLTYKILISAKGSTKVVHHDKLKKFSGGELPKWICKKKQNEADV